MAGNKTEKVVWEMALPVAEELGYELVEVEFVREGPNYYLRLYIDKPGGIIIDDCQAMNDRIEPLLDAADPISQAYYLEVCSPGLDRPLKTDRDFEKYQGEAVEVNLYEAIDGEKHFEGILLGRENGLVYIEMKDKTQMTFSKEKISVIRRLIII